MNFMAFSGDIRYEKDFYLIFKNKTNYLEEHPAGLASLVPAKRNCQPEGEDLPAGRQEILPLEQNYSVSKR
ncbi:hypothetical protein HZC33_02510 [Candidatus Wolfebacteria bacterium]|nr:hypothetical protein [Candidatus Wolfebacteria bacterium]